MISPRPSPFLECRSARKGPRLSVAVLLALVTLLGSAACSQSPEVKKEKALERGERYLKENKINHGVEIAWLKTVAAFLNSRFAARVAPSIADAPTTVRLVRSFATRNGSLCREYEQTVVVDGQRGAGESDRFSCDRQPAGGRS